MLVNIHTVLSQMCHVIPANYRYKISDAFSLMLRHRCPLPAVTHMISIELLQPVGVFECGFVCFSFVIHVKKFCHFCTGENIFTPNMLHKLAGLQIRYQKN